MDAALLLLLRLRFYGALRRMGRKLGTARGLLLTLVGVAFLSIMILPSLFTKMPAEMAAVQAAGFRRFGPLGFLLYCIMILLFSPGDKAFAFSPAEVSFLFPGPFGRKSLLAYKVGGNLILTCFGGLFFLWAFRQFWTNPIAGYIGTVMAFSFLQLFQVGVTVAGQAIGAKAATRRRQLAVVIILAIMALVALSLGIKSLSEINLETLRNLENRPWVIALKAPFRPMVYTITAPRFWPDVPLWGSVSLLINAGLFFAILSLDAQYLEAAAAGSERFYAKLERMRKGGPSVSSRRKNQVWKEMPSLPYLDGIGPIFWRQLTTAVRDYARAVVPFAVSTLIAGFGIYLAVFVGNNDEARQGAVAGMGATIMGLSFALSMILTFDFRGDFERMEGLKTLPLRPSRIVLGQLATPWILLTGGQFFGLALLMGGAKIVLTPLWVAALFLPFVNLLMLEIDNLIFLLFPSRPAVHTPGDVQVMGKIMVMMMFKFLVLGVSLGLAALVAVGSYFLIGMIGALVVGWIILALAVVGFLPLMAMAFERFDVASETPA